MKKKTKVTNKTVREYKNQAQRYRILAMATRDAKKKKEYEEHAKELDGLARAIEMRCRNGYETAAFFSPITSCGTPV